MKTIITLSTVIALILTAPVALAERGWNQTDRQQARAERQQMRINKLMERFDINEDGQITLDEVQSQRTDRFRQLDSDGNGFVSIEELETGTTLFRKEQQAANQAGSKGNWTNKGNWRRGRHCQRNPKRHIKRMDNDEDGRISLEEFTLNVPLFDKFDVDKDGVITSKELSQRPRRY